jgi:hypothetical protein
LGGGRGFAKLAWTEIFLFTPLQSRDCRHAPPQSIYLLRWSLTNILPGLTLNHNPPDLHLSTSWVSGITGVNHLAQPCCIFIWFCFLYPNLLFL